MTNLVWRFGSGGICALAVTILLGLGAAAVAGQRVYPVNGAPYAGAVVSSPGATLAVVGGITGAGLAAEASSEALLGLAARLESVGLDRSRLLRVRAALEPGTDFGAWNEAWNRYFDGVTPPARTTVYATSLPAGATVVIDAVASFPAAASHPVSVSGARKTLNPHLRFVGPDSNPTAIVSTRTGLFLTSGALPGRDIGDSTSMEAHMRSSMNSLDRNLTAQGLQWSDAFFIRVMPTPQPGRADVDFDAWVQVHAILGELTGGARPAYTLWSAPGFGASGRFSEIEVWAVPPAPPAVFATLDPTAANPRLRMSGNPRSFIASGAMIAPNAELAWMSGIVAPEGTPPEEESARSVATLKERVAEMGATLADVAELRVYRVAREADGDDLAEAWNEVYGAEWNNETQPHKPVRTNYLVEALPGGRHVEVEAVVVLPPREF